MPDYRFHNPLLHILDEVDSTNNYAMRMVNQGYVAHGEAWMALHQTSGKGQRGKQWEADKGQNIMMSIVFKPDGIGISEQFLLSAAVALGSYDFVKNYAGTSTRIKWSNDIYIGDKKAGGILIENVIRGNEWTFAIAGIGINLNQERFPPGLPNPVSLFQISGEKYDLGKMGEELYECVMNRTKQLFSGEKNRTLQEYCGHLYRCGEKQLFSNNGDTFEAIIEGVEEDGKLVLKKDGQWMQFSFGEISFLI